MAVVSCIEISRGVGAQATYGDVPTYTRQFLAKTDTFLGQGTTFQELADSTGAGWLTPHPQDPYALLIDASVQPEGDSPFHWRITLTYKTGEDLLPLEPWLRPAQFSFNGSLASAPAFWHYPVDNDNATKQIIVNSAGDPLAGLDRDEGEFQVTITRNMEAPFPYAKAQQYVGAINSDSWSGGAPKTWKCLSITGNRKIEAIAGDKYVYWEVNTSLAYRDTTWDIQTWDVGFNQIKGGKRVKIMAGSEPVSEPAALSNGVEKTPGLPPDMLTFRVYKMLPFGSAFPSLPS